MAFMLPFFRQPASSTEVPAIVRVVGPGAERWNRPMFKAPPLDVQPPLGDIRELTAEIQNRLGALR
jgi:hypothetical protein